jgi:hypothetical protein
MTAGRHARGRLIAVDGPVGSAIPTGARSVVRGLGVQGRSGLSQWDSSGIFTELAAAGADVPAPSARALTLLYAADLAFRLRWQITPALEAGMPVVAAPYVDTAVALGIAAGLPKRWLAELFEFAPKPAACYRASDRGPREAGRPRDGYPEYFRQALRAGGQSAAVAALRDGSIEYFTRLERRGRCEEIAKAVAPRKRARSRR